MESWGFKTFGSVLMVFGCRYLLLWKCTLGCVLIRSIGLSPFFLDTVAISWLGVQGFHVNRFWLLSVYKISSAFSGMGYACNVR